MEGRAGVCVRTCRMGGHVRSMMKHAALVGLGLRLGLGLGLGVGLGVGLGLGAGLG